MAAVGDRRSTSRRGAIAIAIVALVAGGACGRSTPATSAAAVDVRVALAPLHAYEEARRAATDFARLPASDRSLGEDPYVVRALTSDRFVGALRGADAIVLLDENLREIQRVSAPRRPTAIAVAGARVVVAGELSPSIHLYELTNGALVEKNRIDVGTLAMRDVAIGPDGTMHVVEERDGRLITLRPRADGTFDRSESFVGHGAVRVVRTPKHVLVDALLDHSIVVRSLEGREEARLTNDGPLWGFDAIEVGDRLVVVAGGVEDHPLDRHAGFFGYVDSFVYAWTLENGTAKRVFATNASALGVVVPKAMRVRENTGKYRVDVIGAGGEARAALAWTEGDGSPTATTAAFPPGSSSFALGSNGAIVAANPLLDAWVLERDGKTHVQKTPNQPARSVESKLGEALLFTTMMAPWNVSDDAHSRFTCETCHFEGYGDGRIHHTGRDDVHAVTKPLLGLFNNRPHFTRALDPDLTTVAHNEFRVAGAGSDHDPWFVLAVGDHPWLRELGVQTDVSPENLRLSLMSFLMDFTHAPNPNVIGRSTFDVRERRGAAVFRSRCASCHAARFVVDDVRTEVPFEKWEAAIFDDDGAIVWARPGYEKTGVVPYVHVLGARTPSLRRLAKKHPYFTNGSAPDLETLLARVRFDASTGAFFHDAAPTNASALTDDERAALLAFLVLL